MKVIDVHVHADICNAQDMIQKMNSVGVNQAAIFSERPKSFFKNVHQDGFVRLENILNECKDHPELLPVLWIHPDEDGILELIPEAAKRGIMGFKCICNNFFIGEEKGIAMLEAVAKTGKPILFHSGILWDDSASSKYNRPLNWEEILNRAAGNIDRLQGLRFSLAHCSWPWYDETIALYGKFLANLRMHPEDNIEMFFDLTPGTPVSYRHDLLRKLLNCGYDVMHNILWGTDCSAGDYNYEWAHKWLGIDNAIMDDLNIDDETREHIFHLNAERFFNMPGCETYVPTPVGSDGRPVKIVKK